MIGDNLGLILDNTQKPEKGKYTFEIYSSKGTRKTSSFLDMNFKKSILYITLGVILSGIIMASLSALGVNMIK